ncbi:MAG: two-component system sensor histidine kinase NtrB [Candidatus Anammoxibacter sp.]
MDEDVVAKIVTKNKEIEELLKSDYETKFSNILQKFENVDASQLLQSLYLRNDSAGEIFSELDKINDLQLNKALQIQEKIINQIVDNKPDIDIEMMSQESDEDDELKEAMTELEDKDSLDFQKLINLVVFFLRDKHIGNIKKLISNVEKDQYDLKALARIGEFTGLIAHVVRNPLANIMITAEVLKSKFEKDDPNLLHVETIIGEIEKLEAKIEEMVNYKDVKDTNEVHTDEVDIHEIISIVIADLQRKFDDRHINVVTSFSDDIPKIPLLAMKIEEAILNVLQDMIDALPDGGEVNVTTSLSNIVDKKSVVIVMEDTGDGILPENIDQIFDPCFTTRKDGMGLGLYMSRKFINDHGGSIEVENKPEKGARFTIILPVKPDIKSN